MNIAMSGSSGLIGSYLLKALKSQGHYVVRIVRDAGLIKANEKAIVWQERKGTIETTELEGQDAVIHLAGASIADHRWTPEYKKLIEDSRVQGTHLLAKTLASLKNPPRL